MPLPSTLRRRIAEYLRGNRGVRPEQDNQAAGTEPGKAVQARQVTTPQRVVDMRALAALIEPHLTAAGIRPGAASLAEVRLGLEQVTAAVGFQSASAGSRPGLVLDIETLGLRSAPVFLVGLLNTASGEIVQLLAADYAAEPSLLQKAAAHLATAPLVISYNGATFDLPYLADRMRYWRLGELSVARALDVLAKLRGRRAEWPNLRLTTLEEICLGRLRLADIEAAQLPQLYHEAIRTNQLGQLAVALAHNLMDLWACHDLAAPWTAK